ncbi:MULTISPECIES: NADH-quinone oxidoreductase subunit J [Thiomicrorhabdus]|uniref:NADH-quinone oxidoreductase subunit J n=1 Tax=Thiomicrorhabdus heinhorstiae TaxID=2748010 RepID=A0ABS0BTW5_9GAMM|nr:MULTISPECIES: NADH-quinone oxidoreductase subunit J [Thiomicrorhabdus]MBF6057282.1 NADH-quinone oxidoreductase subunit J [Thiomicrorhabdus heinhorstiae]
MTFEQFIFYLLAAIAAVSGLMMITVKNPVKAALWLVLAFISTAGVWITAQAEFLGLVLILVYVGAVMVLFLFVVMMLDINMAVLKEGFTKYLPLGAMAALAIFALMYMVLGPEHFGLDVTGTPDVKAADFSNTEAIAVPLYTVHVYAFVLAAVLLLVGIVAAIALTLRRRPTTEVLYQNIDKQVKTLAADRFRMVKMDAVKEQPIVEAGEEDKK